MRIFSLLMLLFFSATLSAQTCFVKDTDFDSSLFRGFNTSTIENLSLLTGKNFPRLRQTGANHVRGWIRVEHDASNRYYFKTPGALAAMDSVVKMCKKVGLYLVLTVEFLPRQGQDDWWSNPTRKANIGNFWRDSLAKRYKNETIIAAYDLMNEPRRNGSIPSSLGSSGTKEFLEFYKDVITKIRSVDPNHVIVVEVLENQLLGALANTADSVTFKNTLRFVPNLIYSPHGYSPLRLTHQGTGTSYPNRMVYPDTTYKEKDGTMYTANYFSNVTYWANPKQFKIKYKEQIWVGEFSCINWAPLNTQGEWTTWRWHKDVLAYMESLGWSWASHSWREYQGWDPEIPSNWYVLNNAVYTNAKPSKLPPNSARTDTAQTLMLLKTYFAKTPSKSFYGSKCDTAVPVDTTRYIIAFGTGAVAAWNVQAAFPSYPIKKASYPGNKWAQMMTLTDTIKKVRAKQVLIYIGEEDLLAKRSVGSMVVDASALMTKIWNENPDVTITYLKMKPSDTAFKIRYPSGETGIQITEYTNRNIISWATAYKPGQFTVVDTYSIYILFNPKRVDAADYLSNLYDLNQTSGYPKFSNAVSPALKP